jgi:TatA/E family protein of Tat protein translocase
MHHPLFLIGSFGTTEMLLILFVVILLFGAKRIPELFRGMGQGVREFKDASTRPEEQQPQYRDQPTTPPVQPPYQQQYPQQGYPQQPPQGYAQPGYQQPTAPQQGYQQPVPPVYNPNDPTTQPRQ